MRSWDSPRFFLVSYLVAGVIFAIITALASGERVR
jgi:hypothetical protein